MKPSTRSFVSNRRVGHQVGGFGHERCIIRHTSYVIRQAFCSYALRDALLSLSSQTHCQMTCRKRICQVETGFRSGVTLYYASWRSQSHAELHPVTSLRRGHHSISQAAAVSFLRWLGGLVPLPWPAHSRDLAVRQTEDRETNVRLKSLHLHPQSCRGAPCCTLRAEDRPFPYVDDFFEEPFALKRRRDKQRIIKRHGRE